MLHGQINDKCVSFPQIVCAETHNSVLVISEEKKAGTIHFEERESQRTSPNCEMRQFEKSFQTFETLSFCGSISAIFGVQ